VTVVQYTFTHKQYTELHNKTEYTERNVHSNKNMYINKRTHSIIIKVHNLTIRKIIYTIKQKHTNLTTIYSVI
jgi:hypothetical protein